MRHLLTKNYILNLRTLSIRKIILWTTGDTYYQIASLSTSLTKQAWGKPKMNKLEEEIK